MTDTYSVSSPSHPQSYKAVRKARDINNRPEDILLNLFRDVDHFGGLWLTESERHWLADDLGFSLWLSLLDVLYPAQSRKCVWCIVICSPLWPPVSMRA